ncbi:MAG: SMC-Scp complex subunit ScpB [Candidatus Micrarchaeota archaeon]|nr:SMC-Scp complex subunit ScpB [Candidatus Micrarchaeota archaeon]
MDEAEAERIIEAALFMSSRPLEAKELGKLIGVAAPGFVAQRIEALKEKYEKSGSAIEIAFEDGKYQMRLRREYVGAVKQFASEGEISRHALKTLAYISKNEGITKRELFKRLGSGIYSDVAELVEKGFVMQKKAGRTAALHTTSKFKNYFSEGGAG